MSDPRPADPTRWIDRDGVLHSRSWRHRLVVFLLDLGCRHPKGIVCDHRHFEYDARLKGWHDGYLNGVAHGRGDKPR